MKKGKIILITVCSVLLCVVLSAFFIETYNPSEATANYLRNNYGDYILHIGSKRYRELGSGNYRYNYTLWCTAIGKSKIINGIYCEIESTLEQTARSYPDIIKSYDLAVDAQSGELSVAVYMYEGVNVPDDWDGVQKEDYNKGFWWINHLKARVEAYNVMARCDHVDTFTVIRVKKEN